jgi:hypothetical protein
MFVVKLLWMFMYNYSCNLGILNDINTHVHLYIKVHLQTVAILEFMHSMSDVLHISWWLSQSEWVTICMYLYKFVPVYSYYWRT